MGLSGTAREEGLYSIQALVRPISLRFKYHFDGSRQTNRLDKVMSNFFNSLLYQLYNTDSPSGIFHIS